MMDHPIGMRIAVATVVLVTVAAEIGSTRAEATNPLMVETEAMSQATQPAPLQLEAKIPLGNVRRRIDHMAIDLERQRLFIAELGNTASGLSIFPSARSLATSLD